MVWLADILSIIEQHCIEVLIAIMCKISTSKYGNFSLPIFRISLNLIFVSLIYILKHLNNNKEGLTAQFYRNAF